MNAWIRRSVAVGMLAVFVPVTTTACFGRFELVRRTYQFNKEIHKDKWVVWVAFLVMSIVPIYGIAGWLDTVVINSLEFWTGKNPILEARGTTEELRGPGGEVARVTYRPDGKIDYVILDADGNRLFLTVVREADSVVALDENGALIARVGEIDGAPALLPNAAH